MKQPEGAIKAVLMDEAAIRRAMMRITHEIIEKNKGCDSLCLVGIRRGGVPLAELLKENLMRVEGTEVPCGSLDIALFRDDLDHDSAGHAHSMHTITDREKLPFDINGRDVVLVDDVICTGRTIRAAIEALFSNGRPATVQLAVLVDRGHRELPIRPDYVGKNVPTSHEESVSVQTNAPDGVTAVYLCAK